MLLPLKPLQPATLAAMEHPLGTRSLSTGLTSHTGKLVPPHVDNYNRCCCPHGRRHHQTSSASAHTPMAHASVPTHWCLITHHPAPM